MQLHSFSEFYASKTDGELLSLGAEKDSLVEEARLALADELRRRNLDDCPSPQTIVPLPAKAERQADQKTLNPSGVLWLGLFVLDTFIAYNCALRVPRMLVRAWLAWFAPTFAGSDPISPVDWHLRHLALVTIVTSTIAGYIDVARFLPTIVGKEMAGRRSRSPAIWVWIVPTVVLLYHMLQLHESSSVLGPSVSVFRYFFDIHPLDGNWAPMVAQMLVTAPFYSGVGYSLGALVWRQRLLPRLISFVKQD